jgi:aryl-alcohol dehydrogenase-like predicted oxidoreductase
MGTMTFGSMADEPTSLAILDKACDAGVNFIDAAEIYPVPPNKKWAGRTEEICGKWLAGRSRDSVIVATKVAGPGGGWFVPPVRSGKTTLDPHSIERAVDASLKRLGTDYIDLYQTHWPDPGVPIELTLEGLDRVVRAGKVRYVGCSNQNAYGLTQALYTARAEGLPRYETIQNNFSLINRRFEDELANVCRHEKVSCLPYSPIGGGVLSGKYLNDQWPEGARFSSYKKNGKRGEMMTKRFINEKTLATTEAIVKLAADCEMSAVTFAVAWTLTRDFVGSSIIGATTPEQLDDLYRASEVTLPFEALQKVDELTRDVMYPMG